MVKPVQAGEFRPLPDVNENEREKAIRRVADAVHRMNKAIIRAVDQGVSVELVRSRVTMTEREIGAIRQFQP